MIHLIFIIAFSLILVLFFLSILFSIILMKKTYLKKFLNKKLSKYMNQSDGIITVEFTAKRDAIIEQMTSGYVNGSLTLTKDNHEIALPYKATAGEKFAKEE